jgi:hypothetical protein
MKREKGIVSWRRNEPAQFLSQWKRDNTHTKALGFVSSISCSSSSSPHASCRLDPRRAARSGPATARIGLPRGTVQPQPPWGHHAETFWLQTRPSWRMRRNQAIMEDEAQVEVAIAGGSSSSWRELTAMSLDIIWRTRC